jgi:hypothetical protein
MLGILLTAIGWVGASSGLMLWATAEVMIDEHDLMYDSGLILMVGGAIVGIAGMALYRSAEAKVERALAARSDNS